MIVAAPDYWKLLSEDHNNRALKLTLAGLIDRDQPGTALGLRWAAQYDHSPLAIHQGNITDNIFNWQWTKADHYYDMTITPPHVLPRLVYLALWNNPMYVNLHQAFADLGQAIRALQDVSRVNTHDTIHSLYEAHRDGDRSATAAFLDEMLDRFGQPEGVEGFVSRRELIRLLGRVESEFRHYHNHCPLCPTRTVSHTEDCPLAKVLGEVK
jgi:hypothetical protein